MKCTRTRGKATSPNFVLVSHQLGHIQWRPSSSSRIWQRQMPLVGKHFFRTRAVMNYGSSLPLFPPFSDVLSHLSPNDSPPSVAGSFLHPGSAAGRLRAKTLSYRARERHKWKRRTTRPAEFPSERAKDGFQAMFQAISSDRNKRGRKRLLTGLALMNVRLSCPLFAVCPPFLRMLKRVCPRKGGGGGGIGDACECFSPVHRSLRRSKSVCLSLCLSPS